jgi:hypothetical protein
MKQKPYIKLSLKTLIDNTRYEYMVKSNRWDLGIDEVIVMVRHLLLAAGYHPDNVNEFLGEK